MAEFDEKKHPRQKDGKFTNSNFFESAEETVNLSKREWARYYETLGKIKSGTLSVRLTPNGDRVIILENKLIIDNNKYQRPKVHAIKEFRDNDSLNDFVKLLEQKGFLKWR